MARERDAPLLEHEDQVPPAPYEPPAPPPPETIVVASVSPFGQLVEAPSLATDKDKVSKPLLQPAGEPDDRVSLGDVNRDEEQADQGGDAGPESEPLLELPDLERDFTTRAHWRAEVALMMRMGLPCILANTAAQLMVITTQIFVGPIGVDELAAATLANTVSRGRCAASFPHHAPARRFTRHQPPPPPCLVVRP